MLSDQVVDMMLAAGEQTAESAAGELIRDQLDAPRPTPVTWESRWVTDYAGPLGERGHWERRVVSAEPGEWERVG